MDTELTRRAVAATLLGGVTAGSVLSPGRGYLERFAALSGQSWRRATGPRGGSVESPYGPATITYDEHRVPTVEAESELAGYFAVGYAQGTDRLFQMDLYRRRMRGELAAVVGQPGLESDRFHRRMDFAAAAEATWQRVQDTPIEEPIKAYVDGVNAAREREPLPIEFGLLNYEASPWTPVDTFLMEKQISWGLTGSFRTLRRATIADALDDAVFEELFPSTFDHEAPIVRSDIDGQVRGRAEAGGTPGSRASHEATAMHLDPETVASLSRFEWPTGIGSNSWAVNGEQTASGRGLMANDPHLLLTAPPLWYEQRHAFDGREVHGVTFPGVPFVVIGHNDHGGWGVTNAGADVIDFYRYDTDGDTYQYGDSRRAFETREETIEVAGAPDVAVEVRKTVHGPVISRERETVAVGWTGFTGTATALAVYKLAKGRGLGDVEDALRDFDLPTQNFVYASDTGETLYQLVGRIPRREVDGEPVYGDRVFDGSAPEGEWEGFEPYGQSSWDGFVPFEEKPAVVNPDWIGTANQRIVDHPKHPIGRGYANPFRAIRLQERLESLVERGDVTAAEMRSLQRDTVDHRARLLAEPIRAAASSTQAEFVAPLAAWDYRMDRESEAALVFDLIWRAYREELYATAFAERGLDSERYWPPDWVTATLPPDAAWFQRLGRSRAEVLRAAIERAQKTIRETGQQQYGERNVVDIAHPFEQSFLGYRAVVTDGSPATLFNVRRTSLAGSSWRQVVAGGGPAQGILPGGNSGDYYSEQYQDQLGDWANGRYRALVGADGDPAVRFHGGDSG